MSDMVRLRSGWPAEDVDVRRVWHQLTVLADQNPTALRALLLSTGQPSTPVSSDIADELLRRGLAVRWDKPSGQLAMDDSIRAIVGASISEDERGTLTYPAAPVRIQAPPAGEVVTWDWSEQPDLDKIGEIVTRLSATGQVHFIHPGTGSDQYALVISNTELTEAEALEILDARNG
jgi:hypothetical protein